MRLSALHTNGVGSLNNGGLNCEGYRYGGFFFFSKYNWLFVSTAFSIQRVPKWKCGIWRCERPTHVKSLRWIFDVAGGGTPEPRIVKGIQHASRKHSSFHVTWWPCPHESVGWTRTWLSATEPQRGGAVCHTAGLLGTWRLAQTPGRPFLVKPLLRGSPPPPSLLCLWGSAHPPEPLRKLWLHNS